MRSLRRVLCAGVIATAALAGTASAAAPEASTGLQVVGPEALKLSVEQGKNQTDPVTIWVRNATRSAVRPNFSAQLEDTDETPGDVVSVAPDKGATFRAIPAKGVEHYRLVLRGVDDPNGSTGELVVGAESSKSTRGSAPVPATIGVSVSPKRNFGYTYYWVLFGPALLAILLVVSGWLKVRGRPTLSGTIAPANFSYSSGFASTLTVIGALLGTIVAAGVLPSDTTHLADSAYKALNIIFGALIAVSVLIVSAFQQQKPGKDGSPELRAYVWAFLLACIVTAWAAFGELCALWFLIWDINGTSGLTQAGVVVLDVLLVGAGFAMTVYTVRRIGQVVKPEGFEPAGTRVAESVDVAVLPRDVTTFRIRALRSSAITGEGEGQAEEVLFDKPPVVTITPQPPSRPPPRFVL
jgi:hypothetical protein